MIALAQELGWLHASSCVHGHKQFIPVPDQSPEGIGINLLMASQLLNVQHTNAKHMLIGIQSCKTQALSKKQLQVLQTCCASERRHDWCWCWRLERQAESRHAGQCHSAGHWPTALCTAPPYPTAYTPAPACDLLPSLQCMCCRCCNAWSPAHASSYSATRLSIQSNS